MTIDLTARVETLENKVAKLEALLSNKSTSFNSTITWYGESEHQSDSTKQNYFSNYVNNFVFLAKSTTNRAMVEQASITGIIGFLSSGVISLLLEWSWQVPFTVGIMSTTFTWIVLVIDRRGLLQKAIEKGKVNNKPLQVEIKNKNANGGDIERLTLNGAITREQLGVYAREILKGKSMAVHKWTGRGALFTRSQYDDFMSELQHLNYVISGSGNTARQLTKKGKGLMKALAEL